MNRVRSPALSPTRRSYEASEGAENRRHRLHPGNSPRAWDSGPGRRDGVRYRGDVSSQTGSQTSPMEPLARAFERSVPVDPKDGGLFGPNSMVWRVHRDRSFPLAAIRSLMIQALHPLAMAGVAQHSNWQQDPFGRLAATSSYLLTTTYGDTASALAAAAWVRKIHMHVRGTDHETGLSYSAEDPALLLWVHAGMVDSIVSVVQRYGRG